MLAAGSPMFLFTAPPAEVIQSLKNRQCCHTVRQGHSSKHYALVQRCAGAGGGKPLQQIGMG